MKSLLILTLVLLSTSQLFAGTLKFEMRGFNYNVSVNAVVTKYPNHTSTNQTLNYPTTVTTPYTQTINIPSVTYGNTYYKLTSLSFTVNGITATFSENELNLAYGGQTIVRNLWTTVNNGWHTTYQIHLRGDASGNLIFSTQAS